MCPPDSRGEGRSSRGVNVLGLMATEPWTGAPHCRGPMESIPATPHPPPPASGPGQPLLASLPLPLSDTVILGPRGPAPPPTELICRWGHAPPGPAVTRTQADVGPAGAGGAAHPRARGPGPSPACGDQTHARWPRRPSQSSRGAPYLGTAPYGNRVHSSAPTNVLIPRATCGRRDQRASH